ncbi:MAG: FAD:protein FMN transferase [Coriobacteriia bacterium]|nr:FAD:protein FMN transferase [Coriobacteriia bacterium]
MAHAELPNITGGWTGSASATIFAFNTLVTISAQCDQSLIDEAVELCRYFELAFSRTVEDGDVVRINRSAGKPVGVGLETADLISTSLRYCEISGGLFDITMGAVTTLWDFNEGVIPSRRDIVEALRHVGYRNVHVDGTTVRIDDPAAKIDLGGIAKGYITDALAKHLRAGGVTSGLINLGGNAFGLGTKPDGSKWRLGIRDPNNPDGGLIGVVEVADRSAVTSGLYERNFTSDGVLYHHILDPKTGFPAETDVKSVTILSPTSIDGDGLSTALLLMGVERAIALIESLEGLDAIFVDTHDNLICTSGIGTAIPFTRVG